VWRSPAGARHADEGTVSQSHVDRMRLHTTTQWHRQECCARGPHTMRLCPVALARDAFAQKCIYLTPERKQIRLHSVNTAMCQRLHGPGSVVIGRFTRSLCTSGSLGGRPQQCRAAASERVSAKIPARDNRWKPGRCLTVADLFVCPMGSE
jgi:hypothetical protein